MYQGIKGNKDYIFLIFIVNTSMTKANLSITQWL